MNYQTILQFWFDDLTPTDWFSKSFELDQRIKADFSAAHEQASQCELYAWRGHAQGRLAEILILDQFSRNLYRDSGKAYAWDGMALALAQEAVALGVDRALNPAQRSFLYMPYMHSESQRIHEQAVERFQQQGLETGLAFEIKHKAIIDRFGRYPHRNALLGRESTPEEIAFLRLPGSSF